MFTAL